jgi:hypothetical protein
MNFCNRVNLDVAECVFRRTRRKPLEFDGWGISALWAYPLYYAASTALTKKGKRWSKAVVLNVALGQLPGRVS